MRIAFRFENGISQLILTPESGRDKQYLDLCMDGKQEIRVKPTTKDCAIIEFVESKPKSITPTVEETNNGTDDSAEQGFLGRADQEIA